MRKCNPQFCLYNILEMTEIWEKDRLEVCHDLEPAEKRKWVSLTPTYKKGFNIHATDEYN